MERLRFVGVDVEAVVSGRPRLNQFHAIEALRSLGKLGILKRLVPSRKRSFDGQRCCVDLAYPVSGTWGATRVFLTAKVILTS
jgi:hypothetical protein